MRKERHLMSNNHDGGTGASKKTGRRAGRARRLLLLAMVFVATAVPPVRAGALDGVRQLVVATAPSWNATGGIAQRFERNGDGWKSVGRPWPVLFGRNGLAWGSGVRGQEENVRRKAERDGRAPAGLFRIGKIYTYDRALPAGSDYPFHTVTAADVWVDDVNHPDYNRHLLVDPANPPPWYAKQRMRLGDFAYRWLVEIRHNSDPPVPGHGSAIFLHIRRGPQRPSAGCTTMATEDLVTLIKWLRADARPHFVLLPRTEYPPRVRSWGLPSIEAAGALLR
jgi:L,D-peptidoglycan transpeptidase YkuD (ErfK/YbiS/YcfS/YnhG family)